MRVPQLRYSLNDLYIDIFPLCDLMWPVFSQRCSFHLDKSGIISSFTQFLPFFFSILSVTFTMSIMTQEVAAQQVEHLVDNVSDDSVARENIRRALVEATTLMKATNASVLELCLEVERAPSQAALRGAFRRFNRIVRMFTEAAPDDVHCQLVKEAFSSLTLSPRFSALLLSVDSVQQAVTEYKTAVLQELVVSLRRAELQESLDDEKDEELFSQFFPVPEPAVTKSPVGQPSLPVAKEDPASPRKRGVSQITKVAPIPKRSKIPALASLSMLSSIADAEGAQKKRVLVTREKLRAGLHDPKGLLNLVGPSTNALERTKKLELLKSSGLLFSSRVKSFSDKLTAAILSLELGLAGHAVEDTLLFGAKVLSIPGSLKPAQVVDIENNITDGSTTWSHQNSYAKMMIAGSLNQAKRIIEKYDESLYGPAPELLVEKTHDDIRSLLASEEARQFVDECREADPVELLKYDDFIKKVVEAVAPIVPIALRNKSLDGGYLRTALHFLGAAELLFAQYEEDIRSQANPAGVVGMCTAMHAEFKKATLYNEELKCLPEFMKNMKAQYQTSLGLGKPFDKDSNNRSRRRPRNNRAYGGSRGRGYARRGASRRNQGTQYSTEPQPGANTVGGTMGNELRRPGTQGRGSCYHFQSGNCRRGSSCRYLHLTQ